MYKLNDLVVYKRDVCEISNIKKINNIDYYVLKSKNDSSLKITLPITNNNKYLRNLLTKEEIDNLINKVSSIEMLNIEARILDEEYKQLIQDCTVESLIKIIKTAFLRNKIKEDNNKKPAEIDETYLELAEDYLYTEISYSLGITKDEARKYFLDGISE